MIVNRWVLMLRGPHAEEAFALFKAEMIRLHPGRRMRFYTANLTPYGSYAWEAEYESLAEFEKAREARYAAMAPDFMKQLHAMDAVEAGGVNEIWNLE
jgi:hypothetical protein